MAAGFSNAFKVDLLPEGADPYDIRYNVILWVPEEQRGFSNGACGSTHGTWNSPSSVEAVVWFQRPPELLRCS